MSVENERDGFALKMGTYIDDDGEEGRCDCCSEPFEVGQRVWWLEGENSTFDTDCVDFLALEKAKTMDTQTCPVCTSLVDMTTVHVCQPSGPFRKAEAK